MKKRSFPLEKAMLEQGGNFNYTISLNEIKIIINLLISFPQKMSAILRAASTTWQRINLPFATETIQTVPTPPGQGKYLYELFFFHVTLMDQFFLSNKLAFSMKINRYTEVKSYT